MNRIEQEKQTVERMIRLYCRRKEKHSALCGDCTRLLEYAHKRLDTCRYGELKNTCKKCLTHCYSPTYREKIRVVMRYAGPRMILYHPFAALRHMLTR